MRESLDSLEIERSSLRARSVCALREPPPSTARPIWRVSAGPDPSELPALLNGGRRCGVEELAGRDESGALVLKDEMDGRADAEKLELRGSECPLATGLKSAERWA